MEHRTLGKTGLSVSLLGFGGSEIGAPSVDQDTVEKLLNAALDAGLNVIDTAECYRESEEKIGEAVATRRGDFHLFTKCGHEGEALGGSDWDPATLTKSIERSLRRLNVDHVDLVQLHTCSLDQLKQGDVIEVLNRAREAGKTRFVGYSGDNEAASYAVACGAFDTLQTSVNIADQKSVDGWVREARDAGMGVIAKRPIANAAWKPGTKEGDYGWIYKLRLDELAYDFLSAENDVANAMCFTATVPGVSTMIVGTEKPGRWSQNADILKDGGLPPEAYGAIRARWREVVRDDWNGQG